MGPASVRDADVESQRNNHLAPQPAVKHHQPPVCLSVSRSDKVTVPLHDDNVTCPLDKLLKFGRMCNVAFRSPFASVWACCHSNSIYIGLRWKSWTFRAGDHRHSRHMWFKGENINCFIIHS